MVFGLVSAAEMFNGLKFYYCFLQGKLEAVEHERDSAVQEVRKLEEELQTLRVYYR